MIASLSRAGINEAKAHRIIGEFVIIVTIETTRCNSRVIRGDELELKTWLLPDDLTSIIHNELLESTF